MRQRQEAPVSDRRQMSYESHGMERTGKRPKLLPSSLSDGSFVDKANGKRRPRVVIAGAGVSGLSAARLLKNAAGDNLEVVVLEGRDRIGGRVQTIALGDGSRVDLGASYIHGCNNSGNQVYRLAQMLGIEVKREYGGYQEGWLARCRWYQSQGNTGGAIAPSDVQKAWNLTEKIREALSDKADSIQRNGEPDVSVYDFIQKFLPKHLQARLLRMGNATRLVFDRLVSTVWGYVTGIETLSVRIMAGEFTGGEAVDAPLSSGEDTAPTTRDSFQAKNQRALSSGDSHMKDELLDEDALVVSGYEFLVQHLSQGADIRTQKNVCAITSGARGGAVVHTRDGDELTADCVIVTVPLSVLQGKHPGSSIHFFPPLSATKQAALNVLAMGTENKVVMRFEVPFWPTESTPYFQVTGDVGLRFVSLHNYGKPGVLVAHLSPPFSTEINQMTDSAVRELLISSLKKIFGADTVDSVQCLEFVVTRWHEDMFSMGAYSYMPVGSTFEHVHALAQSEGCLFFAGEATSAYDGQCVTGAFDTGAEAAVEALLFLNFCECEVCGSWVIPRSPPKDADAYFACEACELQQRSARYCVCQSLWDDRMYIECERCEVWFHLECVGLQEAAIPSSWICGPCKSRPTHRPRTRRV